MGYNAGGTYFENHRYSGFDTVGNDVSCVIELRRSKRQAGGMMPTTANMMQTTESMENGVTETLIEEIGACQNHFDNDGLAFPDLEVAFSDAVEPCPCHLNQATNDQRFTIDTLFRTDSTCYIQTFAVSGSSLFAPISYGQQCCYDNSG